MARYRNKLSGFAVLKKVNANKSKKPPKSVILEKRTWLDFLFPCITMMVMNIEIRDAAVQDRIRKQLEATGSKTIEEVLLHLLETQEEQDRWLQENRGTINDKIQRGIAQLDRGEGIPEDRLDTYLRKLKATSE